VTEKTFPKAVSKRKEGGTRKSSGQGKLSFANETWHLRRGNGRGRGGRKKKVLPSLTLCADVLGDERRKETAGRTLLYTGQGKVKKNCNGPLLTAKTRGVSLAFVGGPPSWRKIKPKRGGEVPLPGGLRQRP